MIKVTLLILVVCLDSFSAAFAYGMSKIKIPLSSATIISSVGTVFLSLSLLLGKYLSEYIPLNVTSIVGASILLILGLTNLFNNSIKHCLRKNQGEKNLEFKYSGVNFALNLYLDETTADVDHSQILSPHEALVLAVALSLDSLVTGLSIGEFVENIPLTTVFTFVVGVLAVFFGCVFGGRANKIITVNLSWLSGIILILLALSKLMHFIKI